MLDLQTLTNEIRKWSKEVLETPKSEHNDLPSCPFAKHSWTKGRVRCYLGDGGEWQDLIPFIEDFDDTYDVVIYCGTDYEYISADEVEERIAILNSYAVERNLWCMGAHPDTEIAHAANQDHFVPDTDDDYYSIYIQRLDTLIKASDSIEAKGYYQNYKTQDFNVLVTRRKKLWLEKEKLK
tara:strand:+ start:2250 stop:2792 length:543 start_codon:yes stop_codon:yes gene_type:complete